MATKKVETVHTDESLPEVGQVAKPKEVSSLHALIKEKLAAGLSHQMASECAKAQIAEDEAGTYEKVRGKISGITPKATAKA